VTQQWVRSTGARFGTADVPWLEGPPARTSGIEEDDFDRFASTVGYDRAGDSDSCTCGRSGRRRSARSGARSMRSSPSGSANLQLPLAPLDTSHGVTSRLVRTALCRPPARRGWVLLRRRRRRRHHVGQARSATHRAHRRLRRRGRRTPRRPRPAPLATRVPATALRDASRRERTNQPPPTGTWPSGVVSISASCIAHPGSRSPRRTVRRSALTRLRAGDGRRFRGSARASRRIAGVAARWTAAAVIASPAKRSSVGALGRR
jgi:hypothetical protein